MAEERITVAMAAKILGVSKSSIFRRMKSGQILLPQKDNHGYYYWVNKEFQDWLYLEYGNDIRMPEDGY